ncbi:hypothetical protein [Cyclobacterium jeungdonense]|uniref:hypothetical protein n=1 Tax=Cyclobacterium jeungdonense TaxID=708087 RepID=UPI0013D7BDCA|nr:hypothetical protein [Cyclobacterium jeungdonense]
MKFSIKYLLIILTFSLISQQGFWDSLPEVSDFSAKSVKLPQSIKDAFWSVKKDLIVHRFDLPHTQIKVDWTGKN